MFKRLLGGKNGKSSTNLAHHSKSIDQKMAQFEARNKKTIRILLLGPGDSGKTTIVKQMKKIHETLTKEDIQVMGPYIQDAVMVYIKKLCIKSQELHDKEEAKTQVKEENELLRQEILSMHAPYELSNELANKIHTLWMDVCDYIPSYRIL